MRKVVAKAISVLLLLAAIAGISAEAFYPKPITYVLGAPAALLAAIWVRNSLAPFAANPTSPLFGKSDNRNLRRFILVSMTIAAYFAFVYFGAALLAVASGHAQYRLSTVNTWNPHSQRVFTRRQSGRCTRLSASIKTGDGDLHVSLCIGSSFPIILGRGSAIFIETVESPLGTFLTGWIRF